MLFRVLGWPHQDGMDLHEAGQHCKSWTTLECESPRERQTPRRSCSTRLLASCSCKLFPDRSSSFTAQEIVFGHVTQFCDSLTLPCRAFSSSARAMAGSPPPPSLASEASWTLPECPTLPRGSVQGSRRQRDGTVAECKSFTALCEAEIPAHTPLAVEHSENAGPSSAILQ
jgi:hypothetical protein